MCASSTKRKLQKGIVARIYPGGFVGVEEMCCPMLVQAQVGLVGGRVRVGMHDMVAECSG